MNDPRFEIRDISPEVGKGMYAAQPIKEGDFLVEYTGKRIPTKVADEMDDSRFLFEIDEDWTIDGETDENDARYINHSCDPNAEADIQDDHILITAIRDIEPGEEITIDYGEEYYDEFIRPLGCMCGAAKHH